MKRFRLILITAVMVLVFTAQPASAQRAVVRDTLGLRGLTLSCLLAKCSILGSLGDPDGQLFLVAPKPGTSLLGLVNNLLGHLGVTNVEIDQIADLDNTTVRRAPAALYDRVPVWYHNSTVWRGYLNQIPNQLVRTQQTHERFKVTGKGVIAVIDTGADVNHPVLKPVLVAGYDFTRNRAGGDERADVDQSTAAVLDQSTAAVLDGEPGYVNQSTAAVLDQSTAAVLDNPEYAAFGHGTMVAGVIHLVAPTAKIMPLKAFRADGSGTLSDVLRALYYAQKADVDIISMSFNFSKPSKELTRALNRAAMRGTVLVASAGNSGLQVKVWPASDPNVIGVGSTDDYDRRSSFSNYGTQVVWMAAPGEGVVTTYPTGTYAAAWGTSFSTPFVAGTAALLLQISPVGLNEDRAESCLENADWVSSELGKGRLNTYTAVSSCKSLLGLW